MPSLATAALQKDINIWVQQELSGYDPGLSTETKIVREPIHGYHLLSPLEVAILDSPLLQRLRYYHQTALTFLVYPSANHTRLEHSIGVARVAENVARALQRGGHAGLISDETIAELRLAGLLHDVGHCLFSHLSEAVMRMRFDGLVRELKSEDLFEAAELGEILSYLIVTTPAFGEFVREILSKANVKANIDRVARLIIGKADPDAQFMADIIHGPFDADSLDYLLRDCYFCGIKSDVDVERLYYTADIVCRSDMPHYLVMKLAGVPILEQILIAKSMLFTAIYHHQKVRTLECMVKGIFESIWDYPGAVRNPALRFKSMVDFLRTSETDFFSGCAKEDLLRTQTEAILKRNLLKRVLVVSMATVHGATAKRLRDLEKLKTRPPNEIRQLRQAVFDSVPRAHQTTVHDLWVDLPSGPDLDEDAEHCLVDRGDGGPPVTLRSLFPVDEWLSSYSENKWRGHVFYVGKEADRKAAADAAERVLEQPPYSLKLLPMARILAKVPAALG